MRCPRIRSPRLLLALLSGAIVSTAAVGRAQTAAVPPINTRDRAQVCEAYRFFYLPSNHVAPSWTGSVAAGDPGAVNPAYLRATLRRINYFRAMSGLPGNVAFDPANNARCQQAALMMAAQRQVSHDPSRAWKFYNRDAALAAAHSDLDLNWRGDLGPAAVDRYMDDFGPNNACVGHRRWLLRPNTTTMGAGIIPPNGTTHPGVNVTWIMEAAAPHPLEVANDGSTVLPTGFASSWPAPGFVPAALVYQRWSFSLPYADFRRATVRLVKEGRPLPVVTEKPAYQCNADGSGPVLGSNTLVWTLPGNVVNRTRDETYRVQVSGVRVAGQTREFAYTVTSIDPTRPGVPVDDGSSHLADNGVPALR